jgi:replicative DNA helicase Mcm
MVATLNPKTHLLEYQKPIYYINQNYSGKMIDIESISVNLTVTPNHELYIRKLWKTNKYKFIKAGEVNFGFESKNNCKWIGGKEEYFILPEVLFEKHNRYNENKALSKKIKMNNWLRFLGIYLADGSVDPVGTNYRIRIAKQKQPDRKIIEKIIKNTGFHYITEKTGFTIYNKQLCVYLRQFKKTKEKFIPKDIKNLCSIQLKILLNSLILCDGYRSKKKRWYPEYNKYYIDSHLSYCSTSKQLIDDVSEICLKIGYTTTQRKIYKNTSIVYNLTLTKYRLTPMIKKKLLPKYIKKIDYEGKIYCVTVPNHIIYVRKNGKPIWCGNSYRKSMEMYKGHRMSPFKQIKDEIPKILTPRGIVVTFGYHSVSIGSVRGFEVEHILLMSHGGAIHDTIATIERQK